MLQFAFYDDNSEYLPRTYANANCVCSPGSHDADCVKTWCKNICGPARRRFNKECPRHKGQSRAYDLLEFALASPANLAVVPMQDYLELTNDEISHGNAYRKNQKHYHPHKTWGKINFMRCQYEKELFTHHINASGYSDAAYTLTHVLPKL